MNQLKIEIKEYIKERGWTILDNPGWIAKSISLESAELLELFQWGDHSKEYFKENTEQFEKLQSELADVFIYAIEMAIALDLDIEKIIRTKLEKVKEKYPVSLVKDDHGEYLKIKKSHRED